MEHHTLKVNYTIKHKYQPDFTFYKNGILFLVEVKGYFQDANEIQKYPSIRDALGSCEELVFVFENPNKEIHFKSKRKDGTKMTHAEWAEKNRFHWFDLETIGGLIDHGRYN